MANVSAFTGAMPVIPGGEYQIASATRATNYTIQATSIGSAEEAFSDVSFVADGGTYVVEVGFPAWISGTANYNLYCYLCDGDGNAIATIGQLATSSGVGRIGPNAFRYYYTPSAGTRTVNIRFTKESGSANGTVEVDASSGRSVAGSFYLRVSKIVNQNDGLKPFWTPPVMTQLPSQATEGDQVLLYSSSPYAGYQTHQYASGSWRTLADSRGAGAWQDFTPTLSNGWANGNATTTGRYIQNGKLVTFYAQIVLGSTTTKGASAMTVSLPVPAVAALTGSQGSLFSGSVLDAGIVEYITWPIQASSTTLTIYPIKTDSTWMQLAGAVTSTVPFTWGTGDSVYYSGTYEAA